MGWSSSESKREVSLTTNVVKCETKPNRRLALRHWADFFFVRLIFRDQLVYNITCDISLPKGHSLRNCNDKCDITGRHKTRELTRNQLFAQSTILRLVSANRRIWQKGLRNILQFRRYKNRSAIKFLSKLSLIKETSRQIF